MLDLWNGASRYKMAHSVKKISHRLRVHKPGRGAAVLRLALVSRMVFEEVAFRIKCLLDWFRRVDAMLATAHHGNIAQA